MKFNEKLIQLRKEKGLSQEELGEKLNVARQTISKWELGETTPEMDKLVQISEIFDISLDSLIKDKQEVKTENNTNTQKLAGIIITILKVCGILLAIYLILVVIAGIMFSVIPKTNVEKVENENEIVQIE